MIRIKKVFVPADVEPPVVPNKRLTDEEFDAYVDFVQDLTGRRIKVTREQVGSETLVTMETETGA
jgi:hypothetical protein